MFCPKCGTENEEGAQFCKNCGTKIDSAARSAPTQQSSKEPVDEKKPEKNRTKGLIISLIGMLILIFGILSHGGFIIALIGGVIAIIGFSLMKK